jgi:hypothetical protein
VERSDLVQQKKLWACSYSPQGGQGAVSQAWTMRPRQQGLWTYFYCREDGRDPASPPARRCLGANHQHRPGRQVLGEKTLDEMRETKMMRRRKIVMKELGFFPSERALFISKL